MDPMQALELKIAKFLRSGVLAAAALMLIGWTSQLVLKGDGIAQLGAVDPHPLVPWIRTEWRQGHWGNLTAVLGLITLLALPFTRVVLTAWLFFKQGEKLLSAIALFVVAALLVSFALGFEL